jgi:hypothetical protein
MAKYVIKNIGKQLPADTIFFCIFIWLTPQRIRRSGVRITLGAPINHTHSYLMASTGFNLEARQEGYNVEKKQMITADNATKKTSLNST